MNAQPDERQADGNQERPQRPASVFEWIGGRRGSDDRLRLIRSGRKVDRRNGVSSHHHNVHVSAERRTSRGKLEELRSPDGAPTVLATAQLREGYDDLHHTKRKESDRASTSNLPLHTVVIAKVEGVEVLNCEPRRVCHTRQLWRDFVACRGLSHWVGEGRNERIGNLCLL